jgi:hypothetical protein
MQAAEQQAIQMRRDGDSIEKIKAATGLPERKVKALVKDVPKPTKAKQAVEKIPTPFAKSVERVFSLASRVHGIRDYELRDVLHQEYGCTWDTRIGREVSNYDHDTMKRVRAKVRQRAAEADCNVLFVMDWVDEEKATSGRVFLEDAAIDLMARIHMCADEYMEKFATRSTEDNAEADYARRKQRYAAESYLLKLAIKGYSPEPLHNLQERSVALTSALDGIHDMALPANVTYGGSGYGDGQFDFPEYYPEPSGINPFLDYVESQGWLVK